MTQPTNTTPVPEPTGMSMRDYFAAQALAAFAGDMWSADELSLLAARAYAVADAMLLERAKGKK